MRPRAKRHVKAILSWSGGKDSTLTLYHVRKKGRYNVVALLTTLTRGYDRISMHGVRRDLLESQAAALGLPVEKVWIPRRATNLQYESQMRRSLETHLQDGVKHVIFGDLFLEDIRKYREARLEEVGMKGIFPLWGKDTASLADFFIDEGFRAVICCVDPRKLSKDFCGVEFDSSFLSRLPAKVDPCGENGEFHTYVYDGPLFKRKIETKVTRVVKRGGFYFADILPA